MSQRHQSGANVRPAITEASPAAGTLPDESAVPLSVDPSDGGVRVHVMNPSGGGGSGSNDAAGATGSPVPAFADYQGVDVGGTLRGAKGFDLDSGAGTEFVMG